MGTRVTRRHFLRAVSAGATYLALASMVGCALPGMSPAAAKGVLTFRSRPDLNPAAVEVTTTQAHDDTAKVHLRRFEGGHRGPRPDDHRRRRTTCVVWQLRVRQGLEVELPG